MLWVTKMTGQSPMPSLVSVSRIAVPRSASGIDSLVQAETSARYRRRPHTEGWKIGTTQSGQKPAASVPFIHVEHEPPPEAVHEHEIGCAGCGLAVGNRGQAVTVGKSIAGHHPGPTVTGEARAR